MTSLKGGIQVANIVVSFTLDSKLSREILKKHFPSMKYPRRFSGGILKYPDGCLLVFDSGKINVTGIQNIVAADVLVDRFCRIYPEALRSIESKIVNMTAYSRLCKGFDYDKLKKFPSYSYEPEFFPGIHLKVDKSHTSFIIFRSTGRIIITGITSQNRLTKYFGKFHSYYKTI